MVVPGTQFHKVVEVFENHFGAVRGQLIPCDASIQLEDVSAELTSTDAAVFRRVVGMCLYLSRDFVWFCVLCFCVLFVFGALFCFRVVLW